MSAEQSARRYGRNWSREARDERSRASCSDPPILISPERSDEASTLDLRGTANRVEITTELPDCSRDDLRVAVDGTELRIRSDPSATASEGIDRTITLADPVRDDDVAVAYDDPTLTVTVERATGR